MHHLAGEPHLAVNQLEDIVEDEVLALWVTSELEGLGVVHRALLFVDLEGKAAVRLRTGPSLTRKRSGGGSYEKSTGNQDDDCTIGSGWLGIESADLVLDLLKGERLSSKGPR